VKMKIIAFCRGNDIGNNGPPLAITDNFVLQT